MNFFKISRRRMFLAGGATALMAAKSEASFAAPHVAGHDGVQTLNPGIQPATSPITTTIASGPIDGYFYRTVCMYDFKPFNPAGQLTWGGKGTYSASVATTLRATLEIPPGSLVRDVEYYIYNSSGSAVGVDTHLYVPGQGSISSVGASVSVPSTGTITATRAAVSQQGPYPAGARLLISVSTPTTAQVQINGARVGFSNGTGMLGVRNKLTRVYTSPTFFAARETRTITIPQTVAAPGAAAAILNVTALSATKAGALKVWQADAAAPTSPNLYYAVGSTVCGEVTTAISASGQIKIQASQPVKVWVDVAGTIS